MEPDPVLHSQLRLAIISLLIGIESVEFTFIREQTGATAGNLSVQITKLKEAGYIEVTKSFSNNYPQPFAGSLLKADRSFSLM